MADNSQLFTKTLKQNGYSVTAPRKLIFNLLDDADPISMSELVLKTKGFIDRASAYRVVALFEKLNIVHRVHLGWKYKIELSDNFNHHHHHLICTNCSNIAVISDHEPIEQAINDIAKNNNYKLTSHQLEIQGVCNKCQKS